MDGLKFRLWTGRSFASKWMVFRVNMDDHIWSMSVHFLSCRLSISTTMDRSLWTMTFRDGLHPKIISLIFWAGCCESQKISSTSYHPGRVINDQHWIRYYISIPESTNFGCKEDNESQKDLKIIRRSKLWVINDISHPSCTSAKIIQSFFYSATVGITPHIFRTL